MSDARANILAAMARLIERQGYHATGLNEIVQESGAPKGSVYYYFPGGKEQIGAEAILDSAKVIAGRLRGVLGQFPNPAEAISNFMRLMADNMEASNFTGASPLTTAAAETAATSERINQACRQSFDLLLAVFEEKFLSSGRPPEQAAELALYVTMLVEGGILLTRTYRSAKPIRAAARYLEEYLNSR